MTTTIAVHPIHTAEDHAAACKRVAELMGAEPGTPEGDELDILATLIEHWERTHAPIRASTPARVLAALMKANGLTQADLSEIASQGVISEILNGKRSINARQAVALAKRFKLTTDAFLA